MEGPINSHDLSALGARDGWPSNLGTSDPPRLDEEEARYPTLQQSFPSERRTRPCEVWTLRHLPNLFYYRQSLRGPICLRGQGRTALKRKSMPKGFKVHRQVTRKGSKELQQVKKAFAGFGEDPSALATALDDVSMTSSEQQRENEEAQRRLQRFLRISTSFMSLLVLVLAAFSVGCHVLLCSDSGMAFRRRAEEYGVQYGVSALFVLFLGGYLVWVQKKGPEELTLATALFWTGEFFSGLLIFVFLFYDDQTRVISMAINSAVLMTVFNVLALTAWCLPRRVRLPNIKSWIILLVTVLTADACVITVMLVHFQMPDATVVLAWAVAMINLALLVSLTKVLFQHLIVEDSLLREQDEDRPHHPPDRRKRRSILQLRIPFALSWCYLYPALTSYSLFLFVIVIFALLLHFPRIAANFEESRKPYHEQFKPQ